MSYRSIKRVLGESSLERKIRFRFLVCLLILIAISFLWVNKITEDLIIKYTRDKARELSSTFLLKEHLINQKMRADVEGMGDANLFSTEEWDLTTTDYQADSLIVSSGTRRYQTKPIYVEDSDERQIVIDLADKVRAFQKLAESQHENGMTTEQLDAIQPRGAFKDRFVGTNYVYYAPVIFRSDCLLCHRTTDAEDQRSAEEAPVYVLRLTLPYDGAQAEAEGRDVVVSPKSAINQHRAILMAVAILTAVLSVAALYWIVRYMVVKPLEHIRDVTEQVSHGQLDVRANVDKTNDEFEELARSLNRMLRHLLDTQTALQDANNDLDRKVDEQAQLNLKLYEMNQVKSEFLANMSHELRTPLNSIIGFSEILEAGKGLDGKHVRYAGNIRKSGRLLLDLINDILDLAKLEAGKMEVKPIEFTISSLANQLCDMVRPLAESKSIQMVLCADESLPEMYQDQIKIRQILTNLLSNAIKFTPEGGRINVSATRDKSDHLVLEVRDTGVGIAEADREIIFEKFRQGLSATGHDALTREVSGTGLGLSIVREICMLLGGSIILESEVGKGSTFTVRVPWNLKLVPRIDSELAQSIDEITKQQRVDFARTISTPKPPDLSAEENGETVEPDSGGLESGVDGAGNGVVKPPVDANGSSVTNNPATENL